MNEIEKRCKECNCKYYTEWSFGYGKCISCKLQEESYSIDKISDDDECPLKKQRL